MAEQARCMSTHDRADLRARRRRLLGAAPVALCVLMLAMAASAQATTPPENTALPVVSGTRGEGNTLTATTGTWSAAEPIAYAYQWERCSGRGACTQIPGATASSYIQVSGDVGKLVLVTVTATAEGGGSAAATSIGMAAVSWGQNDHGQLGTIYKDPYEELPVDVEGLTTIKAIQATESFNLALLSNGTVASFGGNENGQLGENEQKSNWERGLSHVMVKELNDVTAVAASNEHAMALTKSGTVFAWGANQDGQLGQGVGGFEGSSGIDQRIPNEVPGMKEKVKAIAAGGASDYVLLEGGEVEAWGRNIDGELGVAWNPECSKSNSTAEACKPFICKTGGGNQLCDTTAQPVVDSEGNPIKNVVAIAAGGESAYALLENGHVLSWGSNKQGALGQTGAENGSGAKFILPGEVDRAGGSEPLTHVTELAPGAHHVLAIVEGGEVVGWGSGEEGALGELPESHATCGGKTPCMIGAFAIKGLEHVTGEAVAAGHQYSLVLGSGGVYAFGSNQVGELANGTTSETGSSTPTIETSLGTGIAEISAGSSHGLALTAETPAPHLTVHREVGHIRFSWLGSPYTLATHLNYREFERPGLNEPEPGEEECGGEGEGLYPKTCPSIKHNPPSAGGLTTLEQILEAKTGTWHGAEPITFKYQWQLCMEPSLSTCEDITEATKATYQPITEDLGHYIRLLVTAEDVEGGVPQSVTVPTELTSRVQAAKAKETTLYQVNITKEEEKGEITGHELRITQGKSGELTALTTVPWEFKVSFGSKARWFIAAPE
jgi:alpha-tubulin suppressor-like RCC1 family protein